MEQNIRFGAASPFSAGGLESIEDMLELEAVLEMDSFFVSVFLQAKTLLGPKVIGCPLLILPKLDKSPTLD